MKTRTQLISFGNKESFKPLGQFECLFEGNNNFYTETVYVMPNNFENILSKTACEKLGYITIQGEEKVFNLESSTIRPDLHCAIQTVLQQYSDVFEDDGLLKGYEHNIYIDHTVKPIVQRLRRYPYQLRDKINKKLDRLFELDFIILLRKLKAPPKGLLRSNVYWLNMSKYVETKLRSCFACQAVTNSEKPEPLKPLPLPTAPWCEISVDFLGPLPSGEKLLVILDEYSRFPIVHVMKSTTADCVINKLEPVFALFGYPDKCKTDNGPPFDSTKIKKYMKQNSIHHHKITPLHPQSNANCERFMNVIGKSLKTATIEGRNWRQELNELLFNY